MDSCALFMRRAAVTKPCMSGLTWADHLSFTVLAVGLSPIDPASWDKGPE